MKFKQIPSLFALTVAGVLALSSTARAQKAPDAKVPAAAAGKWAVLFERVAVTHTDTTYDRWRAQLVLTQLGTTLAGTWQRIAENSSIVIAPMDANGALRRDSLRLELTPIVDPDATFTNMAHDLSVYLKEKIHGIIPTTTILELVVRGDSLVGTVRAFSRDGAALTPPGSVTATRIKQ